MSFFAITDAELDLGIDHAFKKFGCTIRRTNLRKVGDRLLMLRQTEGLAFPVALRTTLNYFALTGERRKWYKTALGKMFSSRAKPMHKGRTKKLPEPVPVPARIPTVREGDQYAFALMRQNPRTIQEVSKWECMISRAMSSKPCASTTCTRFR